MPMTSSQSSIEASTLANSMSSRVSASRTASRALVEDMPAACTSQAERTTAFRVNRSPWRSEPGNARQPPCRRWWCKGSVPGILLGIVYAVEPQHCDLGGQRVVQNGSHGCIGGGCGLRHSTTARSSSGSPSTRVTIRIRFGSTVATSVGRRSRWAGSTGISRATKLRSDGVYELVVGAVVLDDVVPVGPVVEGAFGWMV